MNELIDKKVAMYKKKFKPEIAGSWLRLALEQVASDERKRCVEIVKRYARLPHEMEELLDDLNHE